MTTRTKLNITGCVMSIMMFLSVFSKPLHIPEPFQWLLTIGVFVPIGLLFHFIKVQKQEKAEASATGSTLTYVATGTANQTTEEQKKIKKRLWLMMGIGCAVGFSAPLWLPLTGTPSEPKKDFVVGLITAATCCTIIGLRLRKV